MEDEELFLIERLGGFPVHNYTLPRDNQLMWRAVWGFVGSYANTITAEKRLLVMDVVENLPEESPDTLNILAVQCRGRKMFLRPLCSFYPNIYVYFEAFREYDFTVAPRTPATLYLVCEIQNHFRIIEEGGEEEEYDGV